VVKVLVFALRDFSISASLIPEGPITFLLE
jgi:hypothetical protein